MDLKYLSVLLFVAVQVSAQNGLEDCPSNLPRNNFLRSFGDYCMQFVHTERSWGDARKDCQRHGGDLIQIKDFELQTFTVNTLHALKWDKHGVWIGATDSDKEGVWEWATGEPLRYGNWHPGQGPSQTGFIFSSGITEDCALLRLDDVGRWHDYPCSGGIAYHYTYICQYNKIMKPVTVPPPVKETNPTGTTTTKGPIIIESLAPSQKPVVVEKTTESSNQMPFFPEAGSHSTGNADIVYEKQNPLTTESSYLPRKTNFASDDLSTPEGPIITK